MKLSLFFSSLALSLVAAFPVHAQESESQVPLLLEGIWENYNRYVVFDSGYINSNQQAIPQIVLRTFYQWYDDRAAESAEYTAKIPRDSNTATAGTSAAAQEVKIRFVSLTDELFTEEYGITSVQEDGDILIAENLCSGAWDMQVQFGGKRLGGEQTYHVPIAVIGDKLYLNFAIKAEDSDSVPASSLLEGTVMESGNLLAGYWQDVGNANGVLISRPRVNTELLSYYVTDEAVYPLRYWETDMEYDENAVATFSDNGELYSVPKHLWVGDKNYTCTLGKRTEIRNLKKTDSLPEPYTTNSILVQKTIHDEQGNEIHYMVRTSTILAFGEPYLTLTDGTRTIEEIIELNHKLKKPQPKPLFPPHGVLDFDWSIIERPPADYNRRMLDLGK